MSILYSFSSNNGVARTLSQRVQTSIYWYEKVNKINFWKLVTISWKSNKGISSWKSSNVFINLILLSYMWSVWKHYNHVIFDDQECISCSLIDKVMLLVWSWIKSKVDEFFYGYYKWRFVPLRCLWIILIATLDYHLSFWFGGIVTQIFRSGFNCYLIIIIHLSVWLSGGVLILKNYIIFNIYCF